MVKQSPFDAIVPYPSHANGSSSDRLGSDPKKHKFISDTSAFQLTSNKPTLYCTCNKLSQPKENQSVEDCHDKVNQAVDEEEFVSVSPIN